MDKVTKNINCHSGGSAVYGLGLLGAMLYFLQQAQTFNQGIVGFLKALVWPAIVVYKLLEYFQV